MKHVRVYPVFTESLLNDSEVITALLDMQETTLAITRLIVARKAMLAMWDDLDAPTIIGKDCEARYAYKEEKNEFKPHYLYSVMVQFEADW